jgi:hypothetical protein
MNQTNIPNISGPFIFLSISGQETKGVEEKNTKPFTMVDNKRKKFHDKDKYYKRESPIFLHCVVSTLYSESYAFTLFLALLYR